MGCPCTKSSSTQWVYVDEHGNETRKSTQAEAMAAKIRNDHKGEVKPLKV
jgi:hypothetical protein